MRPRGGGAIETPDPDAIPRDTLVDHYQVRHLVGRGGMGTVYLARDTVLGRKVALKLVHRRRLGDVGAVAAFLEEARLTARFSHPNIVAVHGVGEWNGMPYVALEYLEGLTLRQRLRGERMPLAEALRVAHAVALALEEAHGAGVLHRDLKPENVLLARDGRVRVVDFGLARLAADAQEGSGLAGTPAYMSPERWLRAGDGAPADVWALGVCLFEMLAGFHPFDPAGTADPSQLRMRLSQPDPAVPELPDPEALLPEVRDLVRACLAHEPGERPTAGVVAGRIDRALHGRRAGETGNPYRGLLPFGEEHAHQFYGRDAEVALFVERLRGAPLLPVVGASGAGKSSFVFAGVIPRLREAAWWLVVQLRPGRDPFGTLAARLVAKESATATHSSPGAASTVAFLDEDLDGPAAVEEAAPETRSPLELAERLRAAPGALHLVLRELAEERRCRVLLVVDQLEELFTLVEDERERRAFVSALTTAADDPDEPVRVVLTVRDDFLGRLAEVGAGFEQVAVLRPLPDDALAETVTRPLAATDHRFDDPGVVDEMVEAVRGEPAALPLLQFAARALWDRRDRDARLLRRADHDALGGVPGALASHADEVLSGLGDAQRRQVRQLCLRLVTAERTRRVLSREEALDGLSPRQEAAATLDRLVQSRLIAVRESDRGGEIELAHESLVRTWRRLARWLDEAREEVRAVAEIEEAARLWDQRGRRPSELWAGEALQDAERAVRQPDVPVSQRARAFLAAAADLRERTAARRRRGVVGALVATALLALGSGLAALAYANKSAVAELQAEAAESARAEALASGARASLASGDLLAARAQLRASLGLRDSLQARALWWELVDEPVLWKRDERFTVYGTAVSADGRRAAVAASDRVLRVLDLDTAEVRSLSGWPEELAVVAMTADGQEALGITYSGVGRRWSLATGEVADLPAFPPDVRPSTLEVLPDGTLLLLLRDDTLRFRIGTLAPGEDRWRLVDGPQGFVLFQLSPDARWLAAVPARGGAIELWDTRALDAPRRVIGEVDGALKINRVAFHPDGDVLAGFGTELVLWPLDGGAPRRLPGHPELPRAAGWVGADRLAAVSQEGLLLVWDAGEGTVLLRRQVDVDEIWNGRALADGRLLVGRATGLALLDPRAPQQTAPDRGHDGALWTVAVSPDGGLLASGGSDGRVRVWDDRGAQIASLETDGAIVNQVLFSPDGRWLAAGDTGRAALLWSTSTWKEVVALGHGRDVMALGFAADGSELVTGDWGGRLRRFSMVPANRPDPDDRGDPELLVQRAMDHHVAGLRLTSDGERLIVGHHDGLIHVLRSGDLGVLREIGGPMAGVGGFAASGDGRVIAQLDYAGVLRIWSDRGELLHEVEGADGLGRMALTDDGRLLAYPVGRNVRLRDLATGDERLVETDLPGPLVLGLSPDGRTLAVGTETGAMYAWDLGPDRPRWRTVLLSEAPPALLTHHGWEEAPDAAPWVEALAEAVEADRVGERLCLLRRDGEVEAWDLDAGEATGAWTLPGARQVRVAGEGCLVRADRSLVWRAPAGERAYEGAWSGIDRGPGGLVAFGPDGVLLLEADGSAPLPIRTTSEATAALRDGDRLLVGHIDGTVDRLSLPAGTRDPRFLLRDPPASPVASLLHGPGGSLLSAHGGGQLVWWDPETGGELARRKLNGPPTHFAALGSVLRVATGAGDRAALDLTVFEAGWCEVRRAVEQAVPVVWQEGRVAFAGGARPCVER